jgi:hypothetical protein
LSQIDIDYEDGFFILEAAKKDEVALIKFLLNQGASTGLLEALGVAAHSGQVESTKLLMGSLKEHLILGFLNKTLCNIKSQLINF